MGVQYESHTYQDKRFPIIYHTDLWGDASIAKRFPVGKRIVFLQQMDIHWHEAIEILRFLEGSAEVRINEDVLTASTGDIIVVNSNCLHSIAPVTGTCLYDCLIINKDICNEWGIFLSDTVFHNRVRDDDISLLIDRIALEYLKKDSHYKTIVLSKCAELMISLCRRYAVQVDVDHSSRMKKAHLVRHVIRYINQHYGEDVRLKNISNELGYSRFYIAHVFSEYSGMTVMEYLLLMRINMAKKLLANDNLSVQDVAVSCGYRNLSSFCVAFRKKTGQTPTAYRHSASIIPE